jgi:hypothetical protein
MVYLNAGTRLKTGTFTLLSPFKINIIIFRIYWDISTKDYDDVILETAINV